jgi:hypothetical protein
MADDTPKFWMHETTGFLAPVVEAFIRGERLTPAQVLIMRIYLRQWIEAPVWKGEAIDKLRAALADIRNEQDITRWLDAAMNVGIDPL